MSDKESSRPAAAPPGVGAKGGTRPAEPEYTPKEVRAAAPAITRRAALRSAMFGTVGMFFGASLVGAGVMFWPAKVSGFGGKVTVPAKLSEIKVGDPPIKVREGKFYLSRLPDGLIALYWKCPHLGCTVPWNDGEKQFHCPCHGSIYSTTGQNTGGPAPRPMDYMAIEVKGEVIEVDTSKIAKRTTHESKHLTQV